MRTRVTVNSKWGALIPAGSAPNQIPTSQAFNFTREIEFENGKAHSCVLGDVGTHPQQSLQRPAQGTTMRNCP